jgi:hypothetical protein
MMQNDGSFMIAWCGNQSTNNTLTDDIYLRQYNSAGTPLGEGFVVNTDTVGNHDLISMTSDADGNILVLWTKTTPDYVNQLGKFGQRYNSQGVAVSGNFIFGLDTTNGFGTLVESPSGELVIASVPNNSTTLFLTRLNAAGVSQGSPVIIGAVPANYHATVAIDRQGNIIVAYPAYRGGWGVYIRRFNSAGVPQGGEMRIDPGYGNDANAPVNGISIATGRNGFIVAWGGPNIATFRTAQLGDANGDGAVGFADLVKVAQNYGGSQKSFSDGDFNGDGIVNFADLVVVAQKYGTAAAASPLGSPGAAESVFSTPTEVPVRAGSKSVFSSRKIEGVKPRPVLQERPSLLKAKPR